MIFVNFEHLDWFYVVSIHLTHACISFLPYMLWSLSILNIWIDFMWYQSTSAMLALALIGNTKTPWCRKDILKWAHLVFNFFPRIFYGIVIRWQLNKERENPTWLPCYGTKGTGGLEKKQLAIFKRMIDFRAVLFNCLKALRFDKDVVKAARSSTWREENLHIESLSRLVWDISIQHGSVLQ